MSVGWRCFDSRENGSAEQCLTKKAEESSTCQKWELPEFGGSGTQLSLAHSG